MRQQSQRGYYAQDGGLPGLRAIPVSTVDPTLTVFRVKESTDKSGELSGVFMGGGLATLAMVNALFAGALAYHGYRRSSDVTSTALWALAGGLLGPLALAYALGQGFAKPAVKKNRRSRSK